jgi:hypothetical protein
MPSAKVRGPDNLRYPLWRGMHGLSISARRRCGAKVGRRGQRSLQHGQQIDAGDSSVLVGLLGGDGLPDFADVSEPAWFYRTLAGQKEQAPFPNKGNEVRDRLWRRRQNDPEFPKSILGRIAVHGAGLNRAQEIAPQALESRALPKAAAIWRPLGGPSVSGTRSLLRPSPICAKTAGLCPPAALSAPFPEACRLQPRSSPLRQV